MFSHSSMDPPCYPQRNRHERTWTQEEEEEETRPQVLGREFVECPQKGLHILTFLKMQLLDILVFVSNLGQLWKENLVIRGCNSY